MFAVTGATGQVGKALTEALVRRGRQVRALFRDESKADSLEQLGAQPFMASIEDPAALEAAFRGVEGVFVMTPPFYRSHDPRNENALALAALAHALRAAHVHKVVFLSSIGAQNDRGTGAILKLHDMERELFGLGLPAASIRAAYFMENLKPLVAVAKQTGQLPVVVEPLDRKMAMIATKDIGEAAAEILVNGWPGRLVLELEGPEQYSMEDAAAILSKLAGRPVSASLVPLAARQEFFEKVGFTKASSATMVEMSEGFSNGAVAFAGGDATHQRGVTTLEDVLRSA